MKKYLAVLLAVLVSGMVSLAYAQSTPPKKVFDLRITSPLKETHPAVIGLLEWTKAAEKATNGQVKFNFATGTELGIKATDHIMAVRDGTVDMSTQLLIYSAGQDDLFNFDVLPYLMWTTEEYRMAIDLMKPYLNPLMEKKFNSKILMHHIFPPQNLFLSKPINSLGDLKGRKLRAYGVVLPAVYSKLGITPLSIAYLEWPMAMQRGMVDGGITSTDGFADISGWEGAKHAYLDMSIFRPSEFLLINTNSWAKLPADVQKNLLQVSKDFDDNYFFPKMGKEVHEQYLKILKDHGMSAYPFKNEWKAQIAEIMGNFWEEWASKNADKGAKEWLKQVRANLKR